MNNNSLLSQEQYMFIVLHSSLLFMGQYRSIVLCMNGVPGPITMRMTC